MSFLAFFIKQVWKLCYISRENVNKSVGTLNDVTLNTHELALVFNAMPPVQELELDTLEQTKVRLSSSSSFHDLEDDDGGADFSSSEEGQDESRSLLKPSNSASKSRHKEAQIKPFK